MIKIALIPERPGSPFHWAQRDTSGKLKVFLITKEGLGGEGQRCQLPGRHLSDNKSPETRSSSSSSQVCVPTAPALLGHENPLAPVKLLTPGLCSSPRPAALPKHISGTAARPSRSLALGEREPAESDGPCTLKGNKPLPSRVPKARDKAARPQRYAAAPPRPGPPPAASCSPRCQPLTSRPVQLEDVPQMLGRVLNVDAGGGGHGARPARSSAAVPCPARPGPGPPNCFPHHGHRAAPARRLSFRLRPDS